MTPREEIKKMWREAFSDASAEWLDMFFTRAFRDDDVMTVTRDGNILSSLLLQHYDMTFHESLQPVSYVCGAVTRRSQRGKGYMSMLMTEAIRESHRRGDMMSMLIPAHPWLYSFYERFGFKTVFYIHPDRYTALHAFDTRGNYTPIENLFTEEVFEAFHRFEEQMPCRVIHSHRDFLNILDDIRIDSGHTAVMTDDSGKIVSMAWAVETDDYALVTDAIGDSDDAIIAALRQLRGSYADKPFKVLASPSATSQRHLEPRGMARLVNPLICLQAIAAADPKLRLHIKVTDSIIAENNAVFTIAKGHVTMTPASEYSSSTPLDLDVTIEVLTAIVFSAPEIGEVMGLPSVRPVMSLMLD